MMSIILETKRLILKRAALSQFKDLYALRSNPEVMKYIDDGSIQTKEQVEAFINYSMTTGYYEKYRMDFFSVYEKESGAFIGQAGLFHVGFDVNQSDIELAYRLLTQFWRQGYATELAQALIDYGFNTLSLPKIVAAVHRDNEPSRRVLEKCGMSYVGIVEFNGRPLPFYETHNNQIDFNKVNLIPANIYDYSIIQNMASYYTYDMSTDMDWAQDEDGTQSPGIDYIQYWQTENSFPFLIKYQNELAGFAIVDKNVSDNKNDFNMAQFFILKKFTGKGLGRHVAFKCFNQFLGNWEVFVMPRNESSYRFWRRIIKTYTNHQFEEYTRTVGQSIRNVFEFRSAHKLRK